MLRAVTPASDRIVERSVSPIDSSTSAIATAAASGDPGRRILAGDIEGSLAGVEVGAVLHPAVLLALADRAGFVQHV